MVNKSKPRILREYQKIDGEVVKLILKDVVRPHGGSGYIRIPKELVGKYVLVSYDKVEKAK